MSLRSGFVVGAAVVFVLVIAAIFLWPASARTVTIDVEGVPGTKVIGSYEVDGVKSMVDTDAPAHFVMTGRTISFSVQKDDRPGNMTVRIACEGYGYASASATASGGVRGGFKSGKGISRSVSFWATNFQAGS